MRKPKARGNHKPHGHKDCGVCAKPKRYKEALKRHEELLDNLMDEFERWCLCDSKKPSE